MNKIFDICIVLPCYNESTRFLHGEYSNFIKQHSNTLLCFVDDGSTDNTLDILHKIQGEFSEQIEVITYSQNQGKACAVQLGINHCLKSYQFNHIAYLDSDLSIPLEECYEMKDSLNQQILFCFGSRIARVGSTIERKLFRFLASRFVATLISNILSLTVYDTQCGCKVFDKKLAEEVFKESFISRWLFDVEIFFRILKLYDNEIASQKMKEIPLKTCIERGESKLKATYFFKLFIDLYKIRRRYK